MIRTYFVKPHQELSLESLLKDADVLSGSDKVIFDVADINTDIYGLINLGMIFVYNSLAKSLGCAPKEVSSAIPLEPNAGYNDLVIDLMDRKIINVDYKKYSNNTGFIISPIAKSYDLIDEIIADFKKKQEIVDEEYEWLHYPKKDFLNEGPLSEITSFHFQKFMESKDIYEYVIKETIGSYVAIGFYIMLTYIDRQKGIAPRRFKIINEKELEDISPDYLRLLREIERLSKIS
ncbi:TPA: hypothetical protein HA235_05930 [Candidatus Woesearchaeota archaeon]|nr:hypothetical protein [Candidatus Woesearchaeota archaeon]HIH32222.1 hypothetical protein [Candidatus Woesearchaeota archaeon]HIH54722.1 hypothetical protein [Candidatus Woesearchaeota archaeon]HIJ01457.1 hypothetical protein [Candidatus Woesearchaeota archaeon]HIJ14677.1 hypothetical protein [Candidatus Woesearchaeota archaeon]